MFAFLGAIIMYIYD